MVCSGLRHSSTCPVLLMCVQERGAFQVVVDVAGDGGRFLHAIAACGEGVHGDKDCARACSPPHRRLEAACSAHHGVDRRDADYSGMTVSWEGLALVGGALRRIQPVRNGMLRRDGRLRGLSAVMFLDHYF